MSLIDRLKKERARRGATLRRVSRETGIGVASLSRYEAGKEMKMSVATEAALQAWLGDIDVEDLPVPNVTTPINRAHAEAMIATAEAYLGKSR